MTQQVPDNVDVLWARLQSVFDDTPRTVSIESPAGVAGWPAGQFGHDIPDVKTVMVHFTAGWPSHSKWDEFRDRYTNPAASHRGIGPHFYMSYDGTVFRLLTETRVCYHGNHVNGWAIGVETGNLANVAAPAGGAGHWPNSWTPLSGNAEDLPDAKFYARSVNNEILVALWTTTAAGAPSDAHAAGAVMMLPSEAQYRSWALLARWLAERWRIPRDFPLRPHLMRSDTVNDWRAYRAVVDADAIRDFHIRTQLQPPPVNCPPAVYTSDHPATGLPHVYHANVHTVHWTTVDAAGVVHHHQKDINDVWTRLFNSYRGFHGHGYSGSNSGDDHNCPGAWFDWHRFAREVWDFWWYPFDLLQAAAGGPIASSQPRRVYGHGDGILDERYFDEDPSLFAQVTPSGCFPVGDEAVSPHFLPGSGGPIGQMIRMWDRYWGFWHGGMHFKLDAGSPIYASAAGQLVAARLHTVEAVEDPLSRHDPASPYPSTLFVLLRHEVFYRRGTTGDRIDYTQEPARVYSLTMHLGVPEGLNFQDVVAENPVWLNRAIAMKKEYDLGIAFSATHPNPAAHWVPHTTRWTRQQSVIDQALTDLAAGRVARFPEGDDAVRVALGDFLGVAGHMDRGAFGVHLEFFSRDPIEDPWYERVDQTAAASRPYHDERNLENVSEFLRGHITGLRRPYDAAERFRAMPPQQKATLFQRIALRSKSEWALAQSDFPAGNWAPAQALMWWNDVVPGMNGAADATSQLPADGVVWHYHPLGFMAWVNGVTWRSEWPKYRIVDAAGTAVPAPARPPRRR